MKIAFKAWNVLIILWDIILILNALKGGTVAVVIAVLLASFSLIMDSAKINSVFGCELIAGNKPIGRTEPTVQPTPKKFTGKDEVVEDPLAWMNTEYFRKAREECQR